VSALRMAMQAFLDANIKEVGPAVIHDGVSWAIWIPVTLSLLALAARPGRCVRTSDRGRCLECAPILCPTRGHTRATLQHRLSPGGLRCLFATVRC
jgi:hypothetical protein